MNGRKVIVLQKHPENLDKIEGCLRQISEEVAESALFTTNPDNVLREIEDGKEVLVISGLMFDHPLSGNELASKVKEANPNSIFYIFSTIPEGKPPFVDGVFVKDFLMCPEVAKMIMMEMVSKK